MIRNLKILFAAAMALAAFGAFSASGAQASEFHCDAEPCQFVLKPDGTAGTKTAHHVFIIKKEGKELGSFTCNQLAGSGESKTKTTGEITVTGLNYKECNIAGTLTTVRINGGCDYLFTAGTTAGTGKVRVCGNGGNIKLLIGANPEAPICTVTVEDQPGATAAAKERGNITYHNIGTTEANTTEVTVETNVTAITATVSNDEGCTGVFGAGNKGFTTNENIYTTGNTLVTGQTTGGVMSSAWWA